MTGNEGIFVGESHYNKYKITRICEWVPNSLRFVNEKVEISKGINTPVR